jgi:hypothetical protein
MKNSFLTLLVAAAGTACFGILLLWARDDSVVTQGIDSFQAKTDADVGSSLTMPDLSWRMVQTEYEAMYVSLTGDYGDALWLRYGETLPNAGIPGLTIGPGVQPGYYEWDDVMSTSLQIFDVDGRGTEEIYVLGYPLRRGGVSDKSKTVIQEWTLIYPTGAPVATLEDSSAPIGTPTLESNWLFSVNGGVYLDPPSRTLSRKRQEIVAELSPNVSCLEVDPDGRYLLYAEQHVGIWQIDLQSDNVQLPPILVLSSVSHPSLSAVTNMKFRRSSAGVKTLVATAADGRIVYCPDADNDGVFETPSAMSLLDSIGAGLEDASAWSTDYAHANL